MIISFQHNFIFVAIPKTATHSVRNALRPYLGKRDWEQCVLFEQKYFPVDALARIGHGHITCQEVRPFLLPDIWENCYRFCAVRNPFDRFVSFCRFINRENSKMQDDPLRTMKTTFRDQKRKNHILFRPQYGFVTDSKGNLLVDFAAKTESLQIDFDQICEKLGLAPVELERINSSRPARKREHLDQELTEMIEEYYQRDFILFDYSTNLGDTTACL